MRPVAILLACALCPAAGCEPAAPAKGGAPAMDCRFTLRLPVEKHLVQWDGARAVPVNADCRGRTHCAAGGSFTAVTLAPGDAVRIEVDGVTWTRPRTSARALAGATEVAGVVATHRTAARLDGDVVEVFLPGGQVERWPLPDLPPGLGIAAVQMVGDDRVALLAPLTSKDVAWDVPTLIWLRRRDPGVLVPDDAHPAARQGALLGWFAPLGRGWEWVGLVGADRRPLMLARNDGAPLDASIRPGGTLFEREDRSVLLSRGERVTFHELVDGEHLFLMDDAVGLLSRELGLRRLTVDGIETIQPLGDGRDLGGDVLPRGAELRRLLAQRVDDRSLLVIERVDLPTCRSEDRVYLFDLPTGTSERIADGDHIRVAPISLAGAPAWIEADVRYSFVGDEG